MVWVKKNYIDQNYRGMTKKNFITQAKLIGVEGAKNISNYIITCK